MRDYDLAPEPSSKEIIAAHIALLAFALGGAAVGIAAAEQAPDAMHAVEGTIQGALDR